MTTSQSPVAPLISFDFAAGASIVRRACSLRGRLRAPAVYGKPSPEAPSTGGAVVQV
jgi:hypothetical protein